MVMMHKLSSVRKQIPISKKKRVGIPKPKPSPYAYADPYALGTAIASKAAMTSSPLSFPIPTTHLLLLLIQNVQLYIGKIFSRSGVFRQASRPTVERPAGRGRTFSQQLFKRDTSTTSFNSSTS